jgi:hypothetical protein
MVIAAYLAINNNNNNHKESAIVKILYVIVYCDVKIIH